MPKNGDEFLLQVALEERARGGLAAKDLLNWYYNRLRREHIVRSFTSVDRANNRGWALVRIAGWLGVKYESTLWPSCADSFGVDFLNDEPLLVASL
jgi:hypothetical protein